MQSTADPFRDGKLLTSYEFHSIHMQNSSLLNSAIKTKHSYIAGYYHNWALLSILP